MNNFTKKNSVRPSLTSSSFRFKVVFIDRIILLGSLYNNFFCLEEKNI